MNRMGLGISTLFLLVTAPIFIVEALHSPDLRANRNDFLNPNATKIRGLCMQNVWDKYCDTEFHKKRSLSVVDLF